MVKMMDFHRNLMGLLQLQGIGRKKIKIIVEHIKHPENSTFTELIEVGKELGFIPDTIAKDALIKAVSTSDRILEDNQKKDIKTLSFFDANYPEALVFEDSPVLLYYQGDLNLLHMENRAAVIGSRNPSLEGFKFAVNTGEFLAKQGFAVISGLATGCDSGAHHGCLKAGGKTLAFLPSGLLNVYPRENLGLAHKILDSNGCLLSEYSHHEAIHAYKFIERDRLQAATSNFLIVSEFSARSGTIHTLTFAKKYNKKILSSRMIYERSQGGFQELQKKKIPYETLEVETLYNLIKNYKNNKSFVFL
ncbi:DNA-processing protein DprA [Acetobacterium bakii]|uniref:Smf/DprA SLOG domain-containing protein n=1 Tax=Acetobacterium bakii TaxID=52689 RepID=A0A0L6TZK2_9FIRM|nr:DNA-processing protein DprA [Acetobacterium bakii]KNZ40990.1 hypothetical protein AKG39_14900 [Acetobacterium bakii]